MESFIQQNEDEEIINRKPDIYAQKQLFDALKDTDSTRNSFI